MVDENKASGEAVAAAKRPAVYEAPRLTAIGNLRDLLAGEGSNPCDGFANPQAGPDPFFDPGSCGSG